MSANYRTLLALGGYCQELQAVIDRATVEGFSIPAAGTLKFVNNLILGMINCGYWAKRDLILNFAYNNSSCENFSRINWKNPNGNLVAKVGAPIYQTDGWKGTASTSAYLNTNWNFLTNSSQYSLNNASRELIVSELGSDTTIFDGASPGFGETMRSGNYNTNRINNSSGFLNAAVDLRGLGYTAIHRVSSTNVELFKKETQYSRTALSTSLLNATLRIHYGAFAAGNSGIAYYSAGAAVVSEGQLFRSIYNNYLTNIGLIPIA